MTTREHLVATTGRAEMDAFDHPMVIAALARLGSSGGWSRVLTGASLTDPLDLADAALLVSARVLEPLDTGYVVLRKESFLQDPDALTRGMVAQLQRALQHARGDAGSWTGEDLELVVNQGRGSAAAADLIADGLFPGLPGANRALEGGNGRFLDVGTGVAAISMGLCQRFPGLTCVGLDVLPRVLDLARKEVADAGLTDRIELRLLSVADLDETAEYDVAWVPQVFIPPEEFVPGLRRVHAALRPGGALVVPTLAPPVAADVMEHAVMVHAGHVLGGGPMDREDAHALLRDAGFVDVEDHDFGNQTVLTAIRP